METGCQLCHCLVYLTNILHILNAVKIKLDISVIPDSNIFNTHLSGFPDPSRKIAAVPGGVMDGIR